MIKIRCYSDGTYDDFTEKLDDVIGRYQYEGNKALACVFIPDSVYKSCGEEIEEVAGDHGLTIEVQSIAVTRQIRYR